MYNFKIDKTENDIFDICISYGICSILEFNDIEYTLKSQTNSYIIITEEFDVSELIFEDLKVEEGWKYTNINQGLNIPEYHKNAVEINLYVNENLENIFNHYLGIERVNKKVSSIELGNRYYSYGIREKKLPSNVKVNICDKYMSFIGYIKCASLIKNKSNEIVALAIPSNTNELIKPLFYYYKNKETGEQVQINEFSSIKSQNSLKAKIYLDLISRNKLICNEYSNVYMMEYIKGSNKPLPSKTELFKFNNINGGLVGYLQSIISIRDDKYADLIEYTSRFVLNMSNTIMLNKLIKSMASVDYKIKYEYIEELIKMQKDYVKEIYNNNSIKNLGNKLGIMLSNKKGYNTKASLYNVKNINYLQKSLNSLTDEWERFSDKSRINIDDIVTILNRCANSKMCEVCATAILTYAISYKKKEEVVNE